MGRIEISGVEKMAVDLGEQVDMVVPELFMSDLTSGEKDLLTHFLCENKVLVCVA